MTSRVLLVFLLLGCNPTTAPGWEEPACETPGSVEVETGETNPPECG